MATNIQVTAPPDPDLHLRQQVLLAEERAWALLRSIVDESEWDGNVMNPIRVEGKTAWYEIYLHSGTVENIVKIDSRGYRRTVCCAPFVWNDYLDVAKYREYGRPDVDYVQFEPAREACRNAGISLRGLPKPDLFLGQYLGLKYDEKAFFEKAVT